MTPSSSTATDSSSVPASFSLSSVPPTSFTYVAEGGANLVAAYTGENDDDNNGNEDNIHVKFLRGSVLRIRKKPLGAPVLSETTLKEEDASVAFTDVAVVPLLPPRSTPRLINIPINDKSWMEALSKHLQAARPASRRMVDEIDTERGYVVLADNLVGTANDESMQLAVEIKPKWGFLPNPEHLSDRSRPIKTQHCRFCLHRLHKSSPLPDTPQSHVSHSAAEDYCPLDLYSQDRERVLRALHALVKSWEATNGKGNNLKLFYEGQMVIPSENTGFLGDSSDTDLSLPNLLADFLTTSELVRRLAYLQKSLDPLDIEGLNERIKAEKGLDLLHTNDEEILAGLGGEVTFSEYQDFVSTYLANGSVCPTGKDTLLRTLMIAYLLSASFKDCSIIVTIKQPQIPLSSSSPASSPPTAGSQKGSNTSSSSTAKDKEIKAFLVDVDVKSITRLRRYAKLDRDLVDSFERFQQSEGGELEVCREAHADAGMADVSS